MLRAEVTVGGCAPAPPVLWCSRVTASEPSRPLRVLGVCGSLQAHSSNLQLLRAAAVWAPERVALTISDGLRALPHFDPDLEREGTPAPVRAWRSAIAASDALLITCPEYGFSLPGALKNGIDWTIGSGELERKVIAFTASVPAAFRGLMGLAALRQTLTAVSARLVGGEPIARGAGEQAELAALLEALVAEVARGPMPHDVIEPQAL